MEKVSKPELLGVSSKGIAKYLDEFEKSGLEQHGLMLLRHGKVAYEASWKPATISEPHVLFSLSKSFTSAAAAFAVSEGLISYDDRIVKYFKDKLPESPSEWLGEITIKHLLTMSSGLAEESDSQSDDEPDWPKHVLSFPVKYKPGTHFHYNSFGTYLVSNIVTQVTGQPIVEYLKPRLWDKLDIALPYWSTCPKGVNVGGWGLRLSVEDIAKFGQLILCDGMWNGERVLPDFFLKTAASALVDNSNGNPDPNNDWAQGYGMQFWRCVGGYFRGDGMGGQLMIVIEKLDAVIAVTAAVTDMGVQLRLIREYLVPAILPDGQELCDDGAAEALKERTEKLELRTLHGDDGSVDIREGLYKNEKGEYCLISKHGKNLIVGLGGIEYMGPTTFEFGDEPFTFPPCYAPYFAWDKPLFYQATYEVKDGKIHCLIRTWQCPFYADIVIAYEKDKLVVDVTGMGVDELSKKEFVRV